jgi:hypothetical protein
VGDRVWRSPVPAAMVIRVLKSTLREASLGSLIEEKSGAERVDATHDHH